MQLIEAWRLLGIEPCLDPARLRSAYLRRLFEVHPDHSDAPGATADTVALTEAYRTVVAELAAHPDGHPADPAAHDSPSSAAAGGWAGPGPRAGADLVAVTVLGDDTIGVGAPPDETFLRLLDLADAVGEIAFVDRGVGMIQIVVQFRGEPTCQVLLTMQGRSSGITEVFVTIESFDADPPPPVDAVVRLLAEVLAGADGPA